MPISAAQLDALKRFIHPANVFIGCDKPDVFTPLVLAFGVPPAAAGGGAESVGTTSGATSFNYKPSIEGIDIEQTPGKVAPRIKEESLEAKFKLAEPHADRLRLALGSAGNYVETLAAGAVADPTAGATVTATTAAGTLDPGTYYFAYSFTNANGETRISPITSVTLASGEVIHVPAITLGSATGTKFYVSEQPGSYVLRLAGTGVGTATDITAPPVAGAALPPTFNTTAGGSTPGKQVLYVGGELEVVTQCITLVAKIGTFTFMSTVVTLYAWVCIYEATSGEGLGLEWKRAENQMIEVTIVGFADPTRDEGDNLLQVGQLTAP